MTRNTYVKIFSIIGICCIAVILILLLSNDAGRPPRENEQTAKASEKPGVFEYIQSFFVAEDLNYENVTSDNLRIQWVIEKLKERYSDKLSNRGIQVRLLGGLIRYMKKSHPDDWKERIKIIIEKDFPDHAPELIDKLEKLEKYHKFADEKKDELARMGYAQRKDTIQEKRKEIFGSEYNEIFKKKIAREEVNSMLNKLNFNTNLTLNEKLAEYKNFTREFYPNEPDISLGETDEDVMARNYKLAKQFLAMPSVQSGLKDMTAEERAWFLRRVRESMGINKEEADKMAELDKKTDELWMIK